jgi:hypothetical protein
MATTRPRPEFAARGLPASRKPSARGAKAAARTRAGELLGLFAWHQDGPLVARSLGLSLDELHRQLDDLKIRRKAYRLVRGRSADVPRAAPLSATKSGPPVRRRPRKPATEDAPAPPAEPARDPTAELLHLLASVGPRRKVLAERLGPAGQPLPARAVLQTFRAAGLERELGQRERDLIRALYARHGGAAGKVAEELGLTPGELRDVIVDRGRAREIDGLRNRFRREALRRKWPREQLGQLARRREWLEDLGVYEDLAREARALGRSAWERARAARDPAAALQRELRIGAAEARALRDLLAR